MSTREQVELLHELESHGVIALCADDGEIAEVINYEMHGESGDDD